MRKVWKDTHAESCFSWGTTHSLRCFWTLWTWKHEGQWDFQNWNQKKAESCQMKLLKRQFLKTQNEAQNDRCACSYRKCSSIRRDSLSHEKSVGNFPFFPETQQAWSALAVWTVLLPYNKGVHVGHSTLLLLNRQKLCHVQHLQEATVGWLATAWD